MWKVLAFSLTYTRWVIVCTLIIPAFHPMDFYQFQVVIPWYMVLNLLSDTQYLFEIVFNNAFQTKICKKLT